jgi:putrescine transport system permease protein
VSGLHEPGWRGRTILGVGYAFLYLPILLLVAFSFNASRLSSTWSGFSFKWYAALLEDPSMLRAAWVSLKIAFLSATAAVVLGTLAALVLTRFRPFRGKTLLGALITSPLVMPEVVTGLSLLLMFVTLAGPLGLSPKGMLSIFIAHVTFTLAFVSVIVSSRLAELDRSLEEAAMDLGATRFKVFFVITLPIIAPALVSGWLLAFTLSLDDVVIASFTTGPGSATLPIRIYSEVRLGVKPEINAICTMVIALIAVVIVIAGVKAVELGRQERGAVVIAAVIARSVSTGMPIRSSLASVPISLSEGSPSRSATSWPPPTRRGNGSGICARLLLPWVEQASRRGS